MPVRFKGLSEYQRNFLWKKSYLSESYNPSVGRKYSWAGLRSDQLGITKEPTFISKRRVPHYDPQISKSLEWNGAISENNGDVPPEPQSPQPLKSPEAKQKEDVNQEMIPSLEFSRVPKRTRSHSVDSGTEGTSGAVEKQEDAIRNHVPDHEHAKLERSAKPLSEHIDNGVFHNKSQFVPRFQGNSFVPESEYKRNFKNFSPVKQPKSRDDLKENKNLETLSPEKKYNKADSPLQLEVEMASHDVGQPKKKPSLWRHQRLGKVSSEYRAKFLSPAQYLYKAGAWTRVKENVPSQGSLNAMWYAEVKELREKAEFYRKRVQGTHFSRDHLNQIMSDSNCCWDIASTTSSEGTVSSSIQALDLAGDPTSHKTFQKHSPTKQEDKRVISEEETQKNATGKLGMSDASTIPVRRRPAWDAEDANEDIQKQPREEEEEEKRDKQFYLRDPEKLGIQEKSKADKVKEGSDSSMSSGKGGRLPTPKLRDLGGIQRTHHDLTTPVVGGAVLVSPSKVRPSAPEQRRMRSSQDGLEAPKDEFTKNGICTASLLTSPAAGMKTIDPLPLREDLKNTPGQSSPHTQTYWNPSCKIQGCLRDPEFQHNVRKTRMKNFQLPHHETFNNEDADRLSEISVRSAASSLRAFQTLARAQRRKENFWGKT